MDKADTNEGQAGETPQEVFGRPKKPAILRNIPSSKKPKSTSTQKSSTEGLNISWKLIALIVVLLAILGIGVFLFFNSRGNSTNSEEKI